VEYSVEFRLSSLISPLFQTTRMVIFSLSQPIVLLRFRLEHFEGKTIEFPHEGLDLWLLKEYHVVGDVTVLD
jgi:hypothetical protein